MSETTDINQSILMDRFYPIKVLIFIQELFVFPQSIIIQYLRLMSEQFVIQVSKKPVICVSAS